jgi:hypothetical protein
MHMQAAPVLAEEISNRGGTLEPATQALRTAYVRYAEKSVRG